MTNTKSTPIMKDFVVDTERQCFLCMTHVSVQTSSIKLSESLPTSSLSCQTHSVQYLSRYLKMDRLKVFHDRSNIPPYLMSQVDKAKLKVSLCRECELLNHQFSALFRQLEKTEMEIASCLDLMNARFASTRRNVTNFHNLTECSSSKGLTGKAEVAAVLRNEAMQKCSHKLTSLVPRVAVENLTSWNVGESKFKMKANCRRAARINIRSQTNAGEPLKSGEPEHACCPKIKMEPNDNDDIIPNDDVEPDESHIYPDDEDSPQLPNDSAVTYPSSSRGVQNEILNVKVEGNLEDACSSSKLEETSRRRKQKLIAREEMDSHEQTAIPAKTLTVIKAGPKRKGKVKSSMKSSINPEDGKISCGLCPKTFASLSGFEAHYESVHWNIRYKCQHCSKIFLRKDTFHKHRLTAHMIATKFDCDACRKSFTEKNELSMHYRRSTSCRREKALKSLKVLNKCRICGKEFNWPGYLWHHLKTVHERHQVFDKPPLGQ